MARRKEPRIPDAILDQLLAGTEAKTAFDQGGLLDELKKALAERALNAEMDHHLAGEGGENNSRNGYGRKSVVTDTGRIALEVPRDRQASFDPQLIAKYQRRFPGFDDKVVSMYARGMSAREIVGHLRDLYGMEVSPDLVSAVTDAVLDEIAAWQARPLEPVYPLVFFDALRVKIRDEGLVRNKAVHIALGVRADGGKEILGLWLEQNEGAKFWLRVMAELPRRRGRALGRGRRAQGLPRGDPGRLPGGDRPDLRRASAPPQPGLRLLQGPQTRGGGAEGHLPRRGRRRGRGRPGGLRGRAVGAEIPGHRPKLAAGLGRGDPVLRLSRRGPPDPLHDQRHRGPELETPTRGPGPGSFPDRRGGSEAAVLGLEPVGKRMDHAGP